MARVLFCCLALVAAAVAFPTTPFVSLVSYSTTGCTGAVQATSYQNLGTCVATVVGSSSTSTMYTSDAATGNVVMWNYASSASCTGTPTVGTNSSLNVCIGFSKYTTYTGGNLYAITSYTDNSCSTLSSGPQFNLAGCTGGGSSISIGGKLQFCGYASTDTTCSGSTTGCESISHGTCVDTSSGSTTSSQMYDWNAASAATPAVALTALLMAVVAYATKF